MADDITRNDIISVFVAFVADDIICNIISVFVIFVADDEGIISVFVTFVADELPVMTSL